MAVGKNSRIVEGYWFASDREADMARTEAEKVHFLEERMNYENPQSVYAIYQRAIDNRLFQTPVGIEYLRKLQHFLKKQEVQERIWDIPAYTFVPQGQNRLREEAAMKDALKKAQDQGKRRGNQLAVSVMLNIGFIVLVLAMFFVTVSSENPNIINYRRALQDQYASWEQELTEREQLVREKEKELDIER